MRQGLSLHIGLNYVDPNAYDKWNGKLSGCINDAQAMKRIAESQGYSTRILIDNQATASAVCNQLGEIARQLQRGDHFLLTYSGHGGQLPDNTGEEFDGMNETWVLWDRQFIDNEIYSLLAKFNSGVKIFITSDSCHSGTVIRTFMRKIKAQKSLSLQSKEISNKYFELFNNLQERDIQIKTESEINYRIMPIETSLKDYNNKSEIKPKAMPIEISLKDYDNKSEIYDSLRNIIGSSKAARDNINSQVLYISGCQDSQVSMDGAVNGAFTEKLLQVWNNASFNGGYKNFHSQISDGMSMSQTPNYMTLGSIETSYESAKPFLIINSNDGNINNSSNSSNTTTNPLSELSMTGPSNLNRNDVSPTFNINKGGNSYYYVEFATEPSLFLFGNTARNNTNWFATWGERFTNQTYQLPSNVWNLLKNSNRLYYRVGSTSTPAPNWENLKVSIPDITINSCPFITINDSNNNSNGNNNGNNNLTGNGSQTQSNNLSAAVGQGSSNQMNDVMLIQSLLNQITESQGGAASNPLQEDGRFGTNTSNAIIRFQSFNDFNQNGQVKPNSALLHILLNKSGRQQ